MKSRFDEMFADCKAQYANEEGKPKYKWDNVTTCLCDIDPTKLHYVKVPDNLIVIDLDLKDSDGSKSFEKNLEASNGFPPTYAELSQSGSGIHLHYFFTGGDPSQLSRLYSENVEVKVFNGGSALRRKLTKFKNLPIAELSSGLPFKVKGDTKMVDWDGYKNEKILRTMIINNCHKVYHPNTKPSVDYIYDLLDKAYYSGADYDVRDLEQYVFGFALKSTHKADYCTNLVSRMHFCSKNHEESYKMGELDNEKKIETYDGDYENAPIIFFDCETYPGSETEESLFIICWKFQGEGKQVFKMINPTPVEVEQLFHYRMIGFNNRDYDNHILYAKSMGMSNEELNKLSQKIIGTKDKLEKRKYQFYEAYNLSYTDVLDFASASNKQGLKKWEIQLGISHIEMGIPWDKPAPKERWDEIADYCANDVLATEAVFNYIYSDFVAREILADLSGHTVNDTTNTHTAAILTDGVPNYKDQYVYTRLGEMKWPDGTLIFPGYEFDAKGIDRSRYKEGVKIIKGKSIYKGIDPGEGGRKIGYPGVYTNVALLDIASEHPHSAIRLNIFGDTITKRFEALVEGRVAIKHGEYEKAAEILSILGKDISKYFEGSEEEVQRNTQGLADALKTAINACYGLTSASFNNKLKDPRNIDNIVAKYGALFMINLEEEVTKLGYKVVHCSTDSMKVADADQSIIDFMTEYAKRYGFTFEFEGFFEKIALVNEAVYIAKFANEQTCLDRFNYIPGDNKKAIKKGMLWDATGKQFAVPYVFKTLFSHEPVVFKDMCETFNVQEGAIYLDMREELPDVSELEDRLKKLKKTISDQSIWKAIDEKKYTTAQRAFERNKLYLESLIGHFDDVDDLIKEVETRISKGHDYKFIGRVGQFTPVIQGAGGGEMVCIRQDREGTSAVSNSKGTFWLESETLTDFDFEKYVNRDYYRKLVDAAVKAIGQYCDFDWFAN